MKLSTIAIIGLFFLPAIFLQCASTAGGLKEPTQNDNMLVVGRVIVEDHGYTEKRAVYKKNIRLAIMGKATNGKEMGYWATTDEEGYFSLPDVPEGEYALKGVQLSVGYGDFVALDNRLKSSNDAYLISRTDNVIFNGEYFPYEPINRIQSLRHTIFTLDVTNQRILAVRYNTYGELDEIKLHNGEQLDAGRVENYFIEKYPESGWQAALEESVQAEQRRRR